MKEDHPNQSLLFKGIMNLEIATETTVIEKLVKNKTVYFDYGVVNASSCSTNLIKSLERNEQIKDSIFKHLFESFGITPYQFINSPEETYFAKNLDRYVNALLHHDPLAAFNFKVETYANSRKLYVCDIIDAVWKKETHEFGKNYIMGKLQKISYFSDEEKYYLMSDSVANRIYKDFLSTLEYNSVKFSITKPLDSNPKFFSMSNLVYDQTGEFPLLRNKVPFDAVRTTTGWGYDQQESEKHMTDLKNYLTKLFPQNDELDYILGFLSSLLHGNRWGKRAIVLTDDKANANDGKTMFVKFLRMFFGSYLIESKKFLQKRNNIFNMNVYDSAANLYKGKRILISDELTKSTNIDDELLQGLTGGAYRAEIFNLRSREQYVFDWEAGIIFVFNQDCCPKFDFANQKIKERLVVFKMRTMSTAPPLEQNQEIFFHDSQLEKKFHLWRSSFFDILRSKCCDSFNQLHRVPPSCEKWKNEMWDRARKGPFHAWLDINIEFTNDENDSVSLLEIIDHYQKETGSKEAKINLKSGVTRWLMSHKRQISLLEGKGLKGIIRKILIRGLED